MLRAAATADGGMPCAQAAASFVIAAQDLELQVFGKIVVLLHETGRKKPGG